MGATPSSTRKGVTYDHDGLIEDCLFCRIVEGRESDGAPLWYIDSRVAAFVPRSPAARLHFLVVPLQHRTNVGDLAVRAVRKSRQSAPSASPSSASIDESLDLLRHMGRVASFLLREHGDLSALSRCAAPPRALATVLPPHPDDRGGDEAEGHVLDFHRPPYNSINHLHLHALKVPMSSIADSLTFWRGSPWCGGLADVLREVEQGQAAAQRQQR